MPVGDLPPDIQPFVGSSKPEDLQKVEQAYRAVYGTAEVDSIPDPRADPKPSVKPAEAPSRTPQERKDYYKRTYGYGDPDDEGAPKPPESAVAPPQLPAELPPEYVAQIQGLWGDEHLGKYIYHAEGLKHAEAASGDGEKWRRVVDFAQEQFGDITALKILDALRQAE